MVSERVRPGIRGQQDRLRRRRNRSRLPRRQPGTGPETLDAMKKLAPPVRFELHCLVCGYGVVVTTLPLPVCPMCRSRRWTRRPRP
jgi:hypothetical protein